MKSHLTAIVLAVAVILLSSIPDDTLAQTGSERGLPYIQNYTPQEYNADLQNWAIVQDARGVLYVGNNLGVLEYDGVSWRLISLPNHSVARSLSIDEQGRIYVGGVGEFGYLEPDAYGNFQFHSLNACVPEAVPPFGDVWSNYITPEGIYFMTFSHLFRWSPETQEMKVWPATSAFHASFYVEGKFYTRQWEIGLQQMVNDSLRLVPEGALFADVRVYNILPLPDTSSINQKLLLVTRNEGLFLFDGSTITPFKTEADAFLDAHQVYAPGLVLKDGRIMLNTLSGGAVLIDHEGRLLQIIDRNAGLVSDAILYMLEDRTGAVWMALDNGIARVEVESAYSFFDGRNGLPTSGYRVNRYNGTLFVNGSIGIYYLDPLTATFKLIPGTRTQSFGSLRTGGQLLSSTADGIMTIERDRITYIRRSINKDFEAWDLHQSRRDTNRFFVSLLDGVASLYRVGNQWVDEGRIPGISEEVRNVIELDDGSLLCGTTAYGVLHVRFPSGPEGTPVLQEPDIERYSVENGLPGGGVVISRLRDEVYFMAQGQVFTFDAAQKKFIPDSTFHVVRSLGSQDAFTLLEDAQGQVWISLGHEAAVGKRREDGSYTWTRSPFLRFSDEIVQTVFPEADGVVWLGTSNGVIRYDSRVPLGESSDYPVLIRNVTRSGRRNAQAPLTAALVGGARWPFEQNSVRFEYAAPSYESEKRNQFRTLLEGFDEQWSGWSSTHTREFTNLHPGRYVFKVQARNSYQQESTQAAYAFSILPPWYRTWWAYALYAIGFVLFALLLVRGRTYQLQERNKRQEKIIQERTAELREKTVQLQEQKDDVDRLSRIGRDITATLSIEAIIATVYENVNHLMDATVFSLGLYNPEKNSIDLPASREKGQTLPFHAYDLRDKNRLAVYCFTHQADILINDFETEYVKYIPERKPPIAGETPSSILYLPLTNKDRPIGVITAQSFQKNAYTDYHLNMLRNLAIYTAIALDNADAYRRLNLTLQDLESTQERLIAQSKLASLGALTAGIAHEIKNPLNFVNNYAELCVGLAMDLRQEWEQQAGRIDPDTHAATSKLFGTLERNAGKIKEHGARIDSIVRSMLQHSRGKAGERQSTDLNQMLEEDLNLAYHGMRAQDSTFNIKIETDLDRSIEKLEIIPQDVSRALLNIITNACYEAHQRKLLENGSFAPTLSVRTRKIDGMAEIRIRDNGRGIPQEIRDRIFVPFFTTKPSGQGTGLGLSISHDIIVQVHGGELFFESREGAYTEFIARLPLNAKTMSN